MEASSIRNAVAIQNAKNIKGLRSINVTNYRLAAVSLCG